MNGMTHRDAARLVWAVRETRRCLDLSMATGRYTPGFVAELARTCASRGYNLHEVYDEIAILEGVNPRPSRTEAATPLEGPLQGLWWKPHHRVLFREPGPSSSFIVYERLANGSNVYVTLGAEDQWEALRGRLHAYLDRPA